MTTHETAMGFEERRFGGGDFAGGVDRERIVEEVAGGGERREGDRRDCRRRAGEEVEEDEEEDPEAAFFFAQIAFQHQSLASPSSTPESGGAPGEAARCKAFKRNIFKHTHCRMCGRGLTEHVRSAVTKDDVRAYVAAMQMKEPMNAVPVRDELEGKLYLGGYMASTRECLERNEITAVVNAARGLELMFPLWGKQMRAYCDESGERVKVLRLEMIDAETQPVTLEMLGEAVRWIHARRAAGENVLVHCAQGKSRSALVCIAYLMAVHGEDYDASLKYARRFRGGIAPNPHFERALLAMQAEVRTLLLSSLPSAEDGVTLSS